MFTDYNAPKLSFYNPKAKDKTKTKETKETYKVKQSETEDKATLTETDTVDESTQVNIKDLIANSQAKTYDEKKLTAFLNKAYKFVNDALLLRSDELLEVLDNDDISNDSFTYNSLFTFTSISESHTNLNLKVSDMVWNHNGSVLAVSFFIDDHIGPCAHTNLISFFKFNSTFKPKGNLLTPYEEKIELETNACIKCLDSHPTISNLFVAGSYIGEIYLINLANNENKKDLVDCISKIDSAFYKETVISVKFVKYENNIYYIVSISEDGRVLVWDPAEKLKYPVIGFNLKFVLNKMTMPINPTCFANSPQESFEFLLGTYDGNIYKCAFPKPDSESGSNQDYIFAEKNGVVWREKVRTLICNMKEKEILEMKNIIETICLDKGLINLDIEEFFKLRPDVSKIYKNALKAHFEKHFALPTSIGYNSYIRNVFLTTSYDGSLRLYHGERPAAKFFYEKFVNEQSEGNYYTYGTWSPYKPSLFVHATSKGEIGFEILVSRNVCKNVLTIKDVKEKMIKKVAFNPNETNYKDKIAFAYEDGTIEVGSLSEAFNKVGNNEIEKMYKIVSNI